MDQEDHLITPPLKPITTADHPAQLYPSRLDDDDDNAIFFYGCRDAELGFMSNFFSCHFWDGDGNVYCNSEQYFMKKKQETFDPDNIALGIAIMESTNPMEIKKLGRRVKNYDDEVWKAVRYQIMRDALLLKFEQNAELRDKLLATGGRELFEASPTDRIWGIGVGPEAAKKVRNRSRFGKNLLGIALMEVRESLRSRKES